MIKTALATAIVAVGVVGLSGCDVRKTEDGHVQAPKYEVEKKQSADVKLPKYDVTGPDVKVGSKETTVNVPKVETEKRTVTVPSVDVKTAHEKEQEQASKSMGATGTASSSSR